MECLRLRLTVQVPYHARSRSTKHGSRFHIPTRSNSKKVQMKLRDDILMSPVEVNLESTDVADEEQLFFIRTKKKNPKKKFSLEKHSVNNVPLTIRTRIINQSNRSVKNHSILQSILSEKSKKTHVSGTNKLQIPFSKF